MSVVRVAIVRPERTTTEKALLPLVTAGFFFLAAWLLMLILGAVTPWHLGFWHTVLVLIGARLVQTGGSGYRFWTWPGEKGENQ